MESRVLGAIGSQACKPAAMSLLGLAMAQEKTPLTDAEYETLESRSGSWGKPLVLFLPLGSLP